MSTVRRYYHHSESVVLPNGTNGEKRIKISLPDSFNEIIGFGIAESSNGGDANYKIGLKKNGNDILNATHNVVTKIHESVAPKDKYFPFTGEVIEDGANLYLVVETSLALTSPLKIDAIFKTVNPISGRSGNHYPMSEGNQGDVVEMPGYENSPY